MRNAFLILTAFCVGGSLVGCAKKTGDANKPVNGGNNQVSASQWTMKFQSNCPEYVTDSDCIGKYGLAIKSDGTFEAGSKEGAPHTGSISPEDLTQLSAALAPALAQPQLNLQGQEAIDEVENTETITLTKSGGAESPLISQSGTEMKYSFASPAEATALLDIVHNLAGKYPNICLEGAAALKTLYSEMQTCTADADCAFFGGELDIIAPNSGEQWLPLDRCLVVNPLSVGNSATIQANKDKLNNAINELSATCGNQFYKNDCNQTGFKLNGQAAVCQAGTCRPHPTQMQ